MTALALEAARTAIDWSGCVAADAGGIKRLVLKVDGIHCGNCVQRIERTLSTEPDVIEARVNFSTRRLVLRWHGAPGRASDLVARVAALGFAAAPIEELRDASRDDAEERRLLRALAIAAFAAGNVMLLSVAVWAGLTEDMGPATRGMLLWLSALISLPTVVYAGMPFYASAWRALRHRRVNMDVPISVGVVLTTFISLFETVRGGELAYFDAAVSLLLLLLAGRYLDRRARGRARSAATHLLSLIGRSATVVESDGTVAAVPIDQVAAGTCLLVAPGERLVADGTVTRGRSELDVSALSGESLPAAAGPGTRVFAGTINLTAALHVRVDAAGGATLLAEIVRLMEAAEQGRSRYVALADRAARLYVPIVHGLALATFTGWWLAGLAWQAALLNAITVLIVTCPCALGIAVPAVQVVASGRLFRRGVLLKNATALERLAEIDHVVFDKTGTLTRGQPALLPDPSVPPAALALAAGLARASRHPLARALAKAAPDAPLIADVREHPGLGLSVRTGEREVRLGSRAWCGVGEAAVVDEPADSMLEIWLRDGGAAPVAFRFQDTLRTDVDQVVAALTAAGYGITLLSGDRRPAVRAAAARLGIDDWTAGCLPADKLARLDALARAGHRVLMVGDGLNDAPALAAAHASIALADAVDVSQAAADAVIQGDALAPIVEALAVARRARRLARQNFALSVLYNLVSVPLAVAGVVTPLFAAVAMSVSSLTVIANALRLQRTAR